MAFARVQTSPPATSSSLYSNVQAAFSSNVTAGNLIYAYAYLLGVTAQVSSILDTQGNTWQKAKRQTYGSSDGHEIWFTIAGSTGALTATMTPTVACDKGLVLKERSGNATTSVLSDAYATDGASSTSGSVAVPNCLGVGFATSAAGGVDITTASYGDPTSPNFNWYSRIEDILDLGAAGSKTCTADQTGMVMLVAFKPSAASSAPTLSSVSPSSGIQGETVHATLTGTGFTGGSASVAVSGANVTVSSVVVVSDTSITCDFVIGGAAATTARNVTVTTTPGTSGAQTFTVNSSAGSPTLSSISPSSGFQNSTQPITLTGTYLSGTSPSITVSGTGITVSSIVQVNSTTVTANFAIAAGATLSTRTVSITTSDGTSGTVNFTVKDPAVTGTVFGGFDPSGSPYLEVYSESDVFTIDDTVRIYAVSSSPSTGALTAATGTPTYAVFEEGTATPILTGNMTQVGGTYTYLYHAAVTASLANGFEYGKQYAFLVLATVAGVNVGGLKQFKMDYKTLDMSSQAATNFNTLFDNNNTASTLKLSDLGGLTAAGFLNTVSTSYTTAGTVGEKLNRLDAAVTTRTSASDIPTPATIAAQVVTTSASTPVKADIAKVNGVAITGNGASTPWGP